MTEAFSTLPKKIRTFYDVTSKSSRKLRPHPLYMLTLKTDHRHQYYVYHDYVAQDINSMFEPRNTPYFQIGMSNTGRLFVHLDTGRVLEKIEQPHAITNAVYDSLSYVEIAPSLDDFMDSAMLNEHGDFA